MTRRRAAFLDRDGVLNQTVRADGKSCPPADAQSLELIPGAVDAVSRLQAAGYLCICVTNQPDMARGTRTLENIEAMNAKVCSLVALDDLFVCLHDTADACGCRKPEPGMLLAAAEKWDIDLRVSWMVGDRSSDIKAGKAAGCRTVLIAPPGAGSAGADYVCPALPEAADIITSASIGSNCG